MKFPCIVQLQCWYVLYTVCQRLRISLIVYNIVSIIFFVNIQISNICSVRILVVYDILDADFFCQLSEVHMEYGVYIYAHTDDMLLHLMQA